MKQEIQVTITLEVDATKSKSDIKDHVNRYMKISGGYYDLLPDKTKISEESEIYKTNMKFFK